MRPRWSYFIRADTSHGLYSYLEQNPGGPEPTYHELSHGEGFLALLQTKANEPGFYLLDEPDAALSFTASLSLISILHDLVRAGSQIIVATHSPIVAAAPGTDILELGDWGLRSVEWQDLDLVRSWRTFLGEPGAYFVTSSTSSSRSLWSSASSTSIFPTPADAAGHEMRRSDGAEKRG